jgi:sodium-dependent dicarboxylate transporter 2/3/5
MAIAEPMLDGLGYRKGDRFGATFMMGISWAATAAYIMTPIGHASNLLLIEWVRRDVGYSISFFQWFLVGVPMGIFFYFLILGYLRFMVRPDISQFTEMATRYVSEESAKMGPVKLEEKLSVVVFLGVIASWILPGVAGNLLPGLTSYLGSLGYSIPPLIGACLLCLIRVRGKPLLTFRQWMGGAAWGTIALIAAIMALKEVIGDPETGIPQLGAAAFEPLATGAPFFIYRLLGQLWVTIQTNLMSNMVSATLVYTIMVPAAIATGLGNQAALGWAIFAGARAGFALPSATTNTALVTGSGWVPIPFMARHGFIVSIGMVLLCVFVAYPWASFILR